MSNAARLAIPGTGDDGKVPVYDETNDEWDLAVPASGVVTSQPFTKTADYTLDSVDGGATFIMNSSSPLTLFVPTHATDDIELYSFVQVIQAGTGTVTVTAVTPGTTSIRSLGNLVSLAGQYASATLYKADDDLWYLSGALT